MIKWCHNKTHHSGRQLYELLQSSFFTKAECIYHDQIGDLMLRRPNGRPDGSMATRLLKGDQIAPGDQIGDQIEMELCLLGTYEWCIKNMNWSKL